MRRFTPRIAVIAGIAFLLAAAFPASAGTISLAWDPVPGATGYRVYYGTQSGVYGANPLQTSSTSATLQNLQDCTTWYVAVKAYNSAGESDQFSQEISGWPRPMISSATPVMQGQQLEITISGMNFQGSALAEVDAPGVGILQPTQVSCSSMRVTATVAPPAPGVRAAEVGRFRVTVINPDNVFGEDSDAFEVRVNPLRFDLNRTDASTTARLDGKDLIWLSRLQTAEDVPGSNPAYFPDADLDGDGRIDGNDLAYFSSGLPAGVKTLLGYCWDAARKAWTVEACPASYR